MLNTAPTPSPQQIAEQFEVKALEPRLEMLNPYGRDKEQAFPDGCGPDNPMPAGC